MASKAEVLRGADAVKALRKACESGNRIAAREALQAFSVDRWPERDAEGRHVALKELLGEALDALDRGVYGQADPSWDGRSFWDRFESRFMGEDPPKAKSPTHLLESLYKG